MTLLHEDMVTGIREGKRDLGRRIEVRCRESTDAATPTPTPLPFETLTRLGHRITHDVPGVVIVTCDIAARSPSCIEAV